MSLDQTLSQRRFKQDDVFICQFTRAELQALDKLLAIVIREDHRYKGRSRAMRLLARKVFFSPVFSEGEGLDLADGNCS